MSLTKKEHTEVVGKYIRYSDQRRDGLDVRIETEASLPIFATLPEARAIHAELTELLAILDEKV